MSNPRPAKRVAGARDVFERLFERASLAVAETTDSDALFATDFQPDPGGFVRASQMRLATIGERPVDGFSTWSAFLARRMRPAMRTCTTTEERQANLSQKLARAAHLLRTRVDVELEQQNRHLLQSMNARTRLQLRLQTTVEGLSVAAISYYVVGLFTHVVEGIAAQGVPVPVAVLPIWWIVRRIRRRHIAAKE